MPKQKLFVVTDELQRDLDDIPALEPRSILEPFRAVILRWRRDGRSYRNIQQILGDKCKVRVHHETLRRFLKRRAKPRKLEPEEPQSAAPVTQSQLPAQPVPLNKHRPSLQSFRNKPALAPKPTVLEEFHYDEDKPLTIDRTIKD